MIKHNVPISISSCFSRLDDHLSQQAADLKTGRGGLTYTLDNVPAPIPFQMDYRVNGFIGAGMRGALNGDNQKTLVSGKLYTHTGVYITIALLNISGIAAAVIDEAGFVAWFAALCISAFIIFLVVGIRQGLSDMLHTAVHTPNRRSS